MEHMVKSIMLITIIYQVVFKTVIIKKGMDTTRIYFFGKVIMRYMIKSFLSKTKSNVAHM